MTVAGCDEVRRDHVVPRLSTPLSATVDPRSRAALSRHQLEAVTTDFLFSKGLSSSHSFLLPELETTRLATRPSTSVLNVLAHPKMVTVCASCSGALYRTYLP